MERGKLCIASVHLCENAATLEGCFRLLPTLDAEVKRVVCAVGFEANLNIYRKKCCLYGRRFCRGGNRSAMSFRPRNLFSSDKHSVV